MKDEKRKARAYKIKDTPYGKAMKRASKENMHLATMIESAVESYASGSSFRYFYTDDQISESNKKKK